MYNLLGRATSVIESSLWVLMRIYHGIAAISLLAALYLIKLQFELINFNFAYSDIANYLIYITIPIFLTGISLLIMKYSERDSIVNTLKSIRPINNDYLPIYLGYIFVALSMPDYEHKPFWLLLIIIVVLIVSLLTLSQTMIFNPLFILFGFGSFQVKTNNGISVYIISRLKLNKNVQHIDFPNLSKVSEYVYFDKKSY